MNELYLFKNMVEEISLQMASFPSQNSFQGSSSPRVSWWICARQKLSCESYPLIKVWVPGLSAFSLRIHSTRLGSLGH